MKTSLITTFLLSALSVTAAEQLGNYSISYNGTPSATGESVLSLTLSPGNEYSGPMSCWDYSTDTYDKFLSPNDGGYNKDYLRPYASLTASEQGYGSSYWDISFTLTNTSNSAVTFDTISATLFAFAVSDDNLTTISALPVGQLAYADATILYPGESQYNNTPQSITFSGNAESSESVVTFAYTTPITLAANGQTTIYMTLGPTDDHLSNGVHVGLKNISISANPVPEPTTALLGIVALLGLVKRRKR
ncbi:MAG: PEP-CTERM sorting domain-containing protein [Akkermansia sp.]|nr:PEP-CTERM sorting domain-containing protein [Akkermansia sp.]